MRPQGWEIRLSAEVEAAQARPWAWGDHDCATFAWRCARAVADGPTRWDSWFGMHSSEDAAAALIAHGGGLVAMMGEEGRVAPKMAQRGDVVAIREGTQVCLGIREGAGIWVAANVGLALRPARLALAAWRV